MKKMFTLALAALTTTVAFANESTRVERKSYDAASISYLDMEFAQKNLLPSKLMKINGVMNKSTKKADFSQSVILNNSVSSLNDIKKAFAERIAKADAENAGVPMYVRPGNELFGSITLIVTGCSDPEADGEYLLPLLNPVAPLGETTYLNYSYLIDGNSLKLDESINSWSYANWDEEELISENNVTATDLTFSAFPPLLKDIVLAYPTLSSNSGESFQVGYSDDGQFSPINRLFGGSMEWSEEELNLVANQFASQFPGAKVTAKMGDYKLTNTLDDSYDGRYYGTAFSAGNVPVGFEDAPEITYSDNSNAYWSNVMGTEAVASAWCQEFPKPGSPMALKTLSMPFIVQCQANAKLTFDFFEITDEGTLSDEPFKTYEHTFTASSTPSRQFVEIPFTTAGDIDDLPFQLIDKGMMLVITGFNEETFGLCSPYTEMFVYNHDAPINSEPSTAYALVAYRDAQGNVKGSVVAPNGLLGGSTMNSLSFTLDASYPYLQLGANITTENETNEGDIIANAKNANVILKKAEDGVWCELFFSGNDIEEIGFYNYDNPDDETFLDWLDLGIDDEPQMVGQYELAPLAMYFGAKKDTTPGEVNLALTYNGLTYIVHIGQKTVGIDNVTEVKDAVLDWNAPVYNVMGQKVSKGFTGIAIQNGNKFIVK